MRRIIAGSVLLLLYGLATSTNAMNNSDDKENIRINLPKKGEKKWDGCKQQSTGPLRLATLKKAHSSWMMGLLLDAIGDGNFAQVKKFLGRGASANQVKGTDLPAPLHKAHQSCRKNPLSEDRYLIMIALLEYGADPNLPLANTRSLLYQACVDGNNDIALELTKYGARMRVDELELLLPYKFNRYVSFEIGSPYKQQAFDELAWLLQQGANPNNQMLIRGKNTMLHFAIGSDDLKLAGLLLRFNPDLLCKNDAGIMPIHVINRHKQQAMLELLHIPYQNAKKPSASS